MAKELIKPIKI